MGAWGLVAVLGGPVVLDVVGAAPPRMRRLSQLVSLSAIS